MQNNYNGIEEYTDAFEKEYCDEVIRHFELMRESNITNLQNDIGKNSDERIVFDWAYTQNQIHYDFNLCKYFYARLNEIYISQYQEKYDMLKKSQQHTPKGMSVQKTKPYQGYHAWHQETADIGSGARILTYMLYLNDVDKGGETEFLYQGLKITPEAGKLVFFPCGFTFPHRGNPIYTGEKYVITGWYTYDA